MKKSILIVILASAFMGMWHLQEAYSHASTHHTENYPGQSGQKDEMALRDGDLIFQTSLSGQGKAIQLATGSYYTHCGILFMERGKPYVLEAVQPVKKTNLREWIERGENKHYVVKRLKKAETMLSTATIQKMKEVGNQFLGKDYDLTFEWNDKKMYCSELIWKIYKRGAGIEIAKTETLGSFNLKDAIVKKKLKERYKSKIPYNETVISPASIFSSDMLLVVKSN
jgi:uncharacterized protein YycO